MDERARDSTTLEDQPASDEIDIGQDIIARMRAELRSRYTVDELVVQRQEDVLGYLGMRSIDEKEVKAPANKTGDIVEEVRAYMKVTFREHSRPHLKFIFRLLDEIADQNKRLAAYEALDMVIFSTVIYGSLKEETPIDELEKMVKAANVVRSKAFFKRRQKMMPFIFKLRDDIGPHLEHKVLVKEMYRQLMANDSFKATFQGTTERQIKKDLHAILMPADDEEEDELNE